MTHQPEALSPTPKKLPRLVLSQDSLGQAPAIYAFPPNRATLGGTAYLIVGEVNILVDCPAWDKTNQEFIQTQGGIEFLFITHRGAIAQAKELQQSFGCQIVVQEQEAYLLPGLQLSPFQRDVDLSNDIQAIWTPGYSPGSACLYYKPLQGVLFSGRHLLPRPDGQLALIRQAKTFHWPRQQRSLQQLVQRFSPSTLEIICPGANTGFLRGRSCIESAYAQLVAAMADSP